MDAGLSNEWKKSGRLTSLIIPRRPFPLFIGLGYIEYAVAEKGTEKSSAHFLERTLTIVKPGYGDDVVSAVDEAIVQHDFVVFGKKLIDKISPDIAERICGDSKEDIDYLTSGPVIVYCLERIGAVDKWCMICGPQDPVLARETAPESLRAKHGVDMLHNVFHCSGHLVQAMEEIALFWPEPFLLQRTFAMIKPDAVAAGNVDNIIHHIKRNGFTIIARKRTQMTPEMAADFYAEHEGKPFFEGLVEFMSSGPIVALVLVKPFAIQAWRTLMGPTNVLVAREKKPFSLRALYGTANGPPNATHGSDSVSSAEREVLFHFPLLKREPYFSVEQVQEFLEAKPDAKDTLSNNATKTLNQVLVNGLVELCKVRPSGLQAVEWLAHYLIDHNPRKPLVSEPDD